MADTPPKPCPICQKPAADRFRPFCSGRCKDVDLNRWFKGAYAIPAAESADDSDEQERPRQGESLSPGRRAPSPRRRPDSP
jgi:endogenous inhibitor of DNA gyrase (YacG/DUF329 family)